MHAVEKRTLAVRARPDLLFQQQCVQGRTAWTVKDPISLNYFHLSDEEHTVLRMLDGTVSLTDIKAELEQRYPPRVATHAELQWLLRLFHQRGLLLADASGQGMELLRRRQEFTRRRRLHLLMSPLFIRLRGVDPERFLNWLYPRLRWLFRPWCRIPCILLALAAVTLFVVQIDAVYSKLPSFEQFFAARNVVWLMVAVMLTKVLHELAHGLTCKHFGGECHEMGVALLVFTPCLYCDTSDSWMLPNRWHRAAIGAAGMAVEIVLASLCTFLWWFSTPGTFHFLCLNIMFVCSVSTVIFNGNPLLRYDGYYILADVLEIPNLWQRGRAALLGTICQWCFGLTWAREVVLPERKRGVFALYAVAATCYRWVILFSILWFLTLALEPYGLQVLGQAMTVFCLIGLVVVPAVRVTQYLLVPGRMRQVKLPRLLGTGLVVMLLAAAIIWIPLPYRVKATAIIEPRDAARLYVEVPGTLDAVHSQPGEYVAPQQTIAELTNPDVALKVAQLTGQRDRLEVHLKNLRRRQGRDPDAAEQIPHAEVALADLVDRLQAQQRDLTRLTLRAPRDGVIIPPPSIPDTSTDDLDLCRWSGLPGDPENLDCYLETGTLFCMIGDPHDMEAVLVIEAAQLDFVDIGALVEIKLDEYPAATLTGRIEHVAQLDAQVIPYGLSHKTGGGVETITDDTGVERTLHVSYQARVRLAEITRSLLPGFRGRAIIHASSQSLGQRMWRLINKTFRFR